MSRALIGYTGFVGGNLIAQTHFDSFYNSRNIESISGETFDVGVCAAAPAEKWRGNKEPEADIKAIERLARCLATATFKKMILISTVDVYPKPSNVDENTVIDIDACQPYGKHRLWLERFISERFDTLIVRLPGLFGKGLKKNIIYDFLHHNNVSQIHSEAVYQFYNLANIWRDIQIALGQSLKLINFATEPVSVAEVAREAFEMEFTNRPHSNVARYDFRSRYASIYKGMDGYLYSKRAVLSSIKAFVASSREEDR